MRIKTQRKKVQEMLKEFYESFSHREGKEGVENAERVL